LEIGKADLVVMIVLWMWIRGYTHVSDFTILSDRVKQLEGALAKAISRLDDPAAYAGIVVGVGGGGGIGR
jgi:hypothetical protein